MLEKTDVLKQRKISEMFFKKPGASLSQKNSDDIVENVSEVYLFYLMCLYKNYIVILYKNCIVL